MDDEEKEEKLLDDRCLEEFCRETKGNSVVQLTKAAVRGGDEIVKAIRNVEGGEEYDLLIIGRGKERRLPIAECSSEWSEFPELGPLGDTLLCTSFVANAWILAVQRGRGCNVSESGDGDRDGNGDDNGNGGGDRWRENSGTLNEHFCHMTWEPYHFKRHDLEPFFNRGTKSF